MKNMLVLLIVCSTATASEISWLDLGNGKQADVKLAPIIVISGDCGCDPCKCAATVGVCRCGQMIERSKVQPVIQPAYQPSYQPIYQPYYASPTYWGGMGGGYSSAACVGGG